MKDYFEFAEEQGGNVADDVEFYLHVRIALFEEISTQTGKGPNDDGDLERCEISYPPGKARKEVCPCNTYELNYYDGDDQAAGVQAYLRFAV